MRPPLPEVYFSLEWPDGEVSRYYSPSTAVREFFQAGDELTIDELVSTSAQAMRRASERVLEMRGFACTSAEGQLAEIVARAEGFGPAERVKVLEVG